jgi:hypothetical protein
MEAPRFPLKSNKEGQQIAIAPAAGVALGSCSIWRMGHITRVAALSDHQSIAWGHERRSSVGKMLEIDRRSRESEEG